MATRPDPTGRLRPADPVELLDEIAATLQQQTGNDAVVAVIQHLTQNVISLRHALAQNSNQTAEQFNRTLNQVQNALSQLLERPNPSPSVQLPERLTAELSDQATELLRSLQTPKLEGLDQAFETLVEKLELLDFRLKGQGQAFGSSGPSNIADNPNRKLGLIQNSDFPDATTHSKLDTLVSNQLRRTDPLAAGTNLIGYVSSNAVRLSSLGRVFIGSTDSITTSLGDDVRATLSNPADSGVRLLLVKLTATSDGAGGLVVGDVYINPDTGLPTTEYTPFCTAVGAASAAGVFKADGATTALSGGTATDLHIPLQGAGRTEFDLKTPIIISPGMTLGLNIPLGALESTTGAFGVYWIEQPV